MVLFVQENNTSLFQNQLAQSGVVDGMESTEAMEGFSFAYQSTENILGMIAVAAIFVGAAGGLSLIGFRNSSSEKSIVMMHIFGMQKKDLVIKALMDALLYGILSSCAGYACGYLLFLHFSRNILQAESFVAFLSIQSGAVFCNENVGLLFQNYHLIPELTCEENIRMPLCFSNSSHSNEKKLNEWIERMGLKDKRNLFPSQMSGGEQQRTAILRAIAANSQLLFADEPTGALDSKTGDGIIKFLIGYAHRQQKTILLVTHDMDIAAQCDRVMEMADGRIV